MGLGSILGDDDEVTDVWNPFLHFRNAEQELTIAGVTRTQAQRSTRE